MAKEEKGELLGEPVTMPDGDVFTLRYHKNGAIVVDVVSGDMLAEHFYAYEDEIVRFLGDGDINKAALRIGQAIYESSPLDQLNGRRPLPKL